MRSILRRICFAFVAMNISSLAISPPAIHGAEPNVITSIAQIRKMSVSEARKQHPVQIEGVITYQRSDRLGNFVQNQEGGVCCVWTTPWKINLAPGRKVRIEGATTTGGYTSVIRVKQITDIGAAPMPEPAPVSLAHIMAGRWDGQYVEVRGVVRAVRKHHTGQHTIDIASDGHRVTATVELSSQFDPSNLVDGIVRVRAVAGINCNLLGQLVSVALRVYRMEDVVLEVPPPADPFQMGSQPIQNIMKFSMEPVENHRLKVTGTVLYQQPDGIFYLRDSSAGVVVRAPPPASLVAGERVEVLGFPVWGDYSPQLEDACFRRVDSEPPVAPMKITMERLVGERIDTQLVQLEAMLVARIQNQKEHLLMLRDGDILLPVRMALSNGPLPTLRLGSVLSVTGISRAQLKDRIFRTGQVPVPDMDLVVRSPEDIRVIHAASWWNLEHTLWVTAGISMLLLWAMGWGILLRRRVIHQTNVIADKLRTESAHEERVRVARELHDTVEQDLTALALHLSAIQNHGGPLTAVTQENLTRALRQVRRSQDDAHFAVWNLRSETLNTSGLPAALDEVIHFVAVENEVETQCIIHGTPRRLAGMAEHHLLRIAQEAITNALRHAGAKKISAILTYSADFTELRIEDDGCGFDPSTQKCPSQHFGLIGMKERSARMDATLAILSAPGKGTVIKVSRPNSASARL